MKGKRFDRLEKIDQMGSLGLPDSLIQSNEVSGLAAELVAVAKTLRVPAEFGKPLSDLMRLVNCHYSNLIEGNELHPVAIEAALRGDYSGDARERKLQLEGEAHVRVQEWLDNGNLRDGVTSAAGLCEIHRRFCENLPEELLCRVADGTDRQSRIVPGKLRVTDVKVGAHVPISPGAVPRFLAAFEQAYTGLGKVDKVIAAAVAHHRLLWIFPFPDGNGRVARLLAQTMLVDALGTKAVWSVSRGLMRNRYDYMRGLIACDGKVKQGNGNWTLDESELVAFTSLFLVLCIDQIRFMVRLLKPKRLQENILHWAVQLIGQGALPAKAELVLAAVLQRGKLPRAEVAKIKGVTPSQARDISAALLGTGALVAPGPRAALRFALPAHLAHHWLPSLFPDLPDTE